jgi:hypothetical protein
MKSVEFRAPIIAAQQNANSMNYLTKNLSDSDAGKRLLADVQKRLGNAIERFPDWHPILTAPQQPVGEHVHSLQQLSVYNDTAHTVEFVRGFVTCPYSENRAERLVRSVNEVGGLRSYRLQGPLYADNAYPVVVEAVDVMLEADGTIRGRDALRWFLALSAREAESANVAEMWWNVRLNVLGGPHGSRSSLFVNQHTGVHLRKILEALNESGVFGPLKESSLDMLSPKKRKQISENLIRAALNSWDKSERDIEFEFRGEVCRASLRDTWGDGEEVSVRVEIGKFDLLTSGHYEPKTNSLTHSDPTGKRKLAEKFL